MAEKSLSDVEIDSFFSVSRLTLVEWSESYLNRKLCEELLLIEDLGGSSGTLEKLLVNPSIGLDASSGHQARIQLYGDNRRPEIESTSFLSLCWDAAGDMTLRVLFLCGLVSLIIGLTLGEDPTYDWIEGAAILLAVSIVVIVTGLNNYQNEKKFRELQAVYKDRKFVGVLRNGTVTQLHPQELLVGDIIELNSGMIIPADGLVLQSFNLVSSEAAITGENDHLRKETYEECMKQYNRFKETHPNIDPEAHLSHEIPSCIVLSGSVISDGRGLMVVTAVGSNSAEGRILDLAEQENEDTPLTKKLDHVAKVISKFGLAAGIIVVVALYLRFLIELATGKLIWTTGDHASELLQYLIVGITVLVVAIPEGLPLAVTIALAYSVMKMQKDNNLVKRMESCETMGSANVVCSDKTGTLTAGVMKVTQMWIDCSDLDFEMESPTSKSFSPPLLALLKEHISLNTSADLHPEKGEIGSKTETALLKFLLQLGHGDWINLRKQFAARPQKVHQFNSARKRGSTVVTREDGSLFVHLTGAPDMVLSACRDYLDLEASSQPLSESVLTGLKNSITKQESKGRRVLCLAMKMINSIDEAEGEDEEGFPVIEKSDFSLICAIVLKDPIRTDVPDAVTQCRKAGIHVLMLTGDSKNTAKAIAEECGLLSANGTILDGLEFNRLVKGTVCSKCLTRECPCPRGSKKEGEQTESMRKDVVGDLPAFLELIPTMEVLARSRPQDKYTLVTGLKQLGNIVAVTGDGTNDAPALRKADVGFAMGSGTELARETADIILIDDNFVSIVSAVKWGRNIYDNIQRFIQFQLTVNIVAVTCAVVGAVTIQQSPLTATQMLWVNLIMDTLASLALATAPPNDQVLQRRPYVKTDSMITKKMWKHIIGQAGLQLCILFLMMFAGERFLPEYGHSPHILYNPDNPSCVISGRLYHIDGTKDYYDNYGNLDVGPSRHFTYIFNTFVFMQLLNEFNCRKVRDEVNIFAGLLDNRMYMYIWLFTACVQVLMVEFGNIAMSCNAEGLTIQQWCISLGFAGFSLVWRLILRLLLRKDGFDNEGRKIHSIGSQYRFENRRLLTDENIVKTVRVDIQK